MRGGTEGQEGPTAVRAERGRLAQFLDNSVSNAIRYSPAGGCVTLSVALESDGVVIGVADQGPGLTGDQREQIFERFYRAHNAQRVEGSGIGLVGAKQIIERHGGTIAITSAEGEGTIVVVRLPLAP